MNYVMTLPPLPTPFQPEGRLSDGPFPTTPILGAVEGPLALPRRGALVRIPFFSGSARGPFFRGFRVRPFLTVFCCGFRVRRFSAFFACGRVSKA